MDIPSKLSTKRYEVDLIADLPEGSTWKDRREYYRGVIERIRSASDTHRGWYTHKNPYGCWICDSLAVMETLVNYLDDLSE